MPKLPPTSGSPRRQDGMTLLELLLVVVVITALLILGVPTFKGIYEQSKSVTCSKRLRDIGSLFHHYAADRNGAVRFLRDGSGSPMWYTALKEQGNLSDEAAQKAFGCPSRPWQEVGPWWCYGMRVGYLTPLIANDPGFPLDRTDSSAHYGFRLSKVEQPGRFFLMSDSALSSERQTFRIAGRTLYSTGGVVLRHKDQANVLFLDGHVEPLTASGLQELHFQQVLDSNHNPLSL